MLICIFIALCNLSWHTQNDMMIRAGFIRLSPKPTVLCRPSFIPFNWLVWRGTKLPDWMNNYGPPRAFFHIVQVCIAYVQCTLWQTYLAKRLLAGCNVRDTLNSQHFLCLLFFFWFWSPLSSSLAELGWPIFGACKWELLRSCTGLCWDFTQSCSCVAQAGSTFYQTNFSSTLKLE